MKKKNHHIKQIFLLTCGVCCFPGIQAQDEQLETRSEFSISAGGGMTSFYTKDPLNVEQQAGLGGNAGLSFTYFLSPRIGIGTGIEIATYQSKYTANQVSGQATGIDPRNPDYDYTLDYTYQNFEERLSNSQFQIPIYLQLQGSGWPRFYMQTGIRLGYLLSSKSNITADRLSVTGSFSYEGQSYHDTGDGLETTRKVNQKIDIKFMSPDCKLFIEVGPKWKSQNSDGLYCGFYCEYGISNLLQQPMSVPEIINKGESEYITHDLIHNTSINALRSIAVGVKLRYAFGTSSMLIVKQPEMNKRQKSAHTNELPYPNASVYHRINDSFTSSSQDTVPVTGQTIVQETEADKSVSYYVVTPIYNEYDMPVEEPLYQSTDNYSYPVFDQGIVSEAELQHIMLSMREQAMGVLSEPIDNYSDIAEYELTSSMKKILDRKVALLKNETNIALIVSGHTCNVKSEAINNEIGMLRANEVKNYMVSQGIAPTRITTTSVGDQDPVTTNNTEAGKRKNRRVTFTTIYSTSIQYPSGR